jgi:uncharacterized membrane protein YphA (DoxX/SURF4 family)
VTSDLLRAVCRVGTGVFWLYYAQQKWGGIDWMRPLIQHSAAVNPLPGIHELMVRVVSPNWTLFALLQAAGETVCGVLLVLGLGTRLAASLGVLLSLGLSTSVAFLDTDVGLRWLYYLPVLLNLSVAVAGAGQPALERMIAVPRWLRS